MIRCDFNAEKVILIHYYTSTKRVYVNVSHFYTINLYLHYYLRARTAYNMCVATAIAAWLPRYGYIATAAVSESKRKSVKRAYARPYIMLQYILYM